MIKHLSIYLLCFILTTNSTQCKENLENVSQNEHKTNWMGIGAALSGFKLGYYLADRMLKVEDLITWENDIEWEDRFVSSYMNTQPSRNFLLLVIENYAAAIGNTCGFIFKKVDENKAIRSVEQSIKWDTNNIKSNANIDKEVNEKLMTEFTEWIDYSLLCDKFKYFIIEKAAFNKDYLNPEVALFNYKLFELKKNKGEMNADLSAFLNIMQTSVRELKTFKDIEETHKQYMYALINYYMDREHKLRTFDNSL